MGASRISSELGRLELFADASGAELEQARALLTALVIGEGVVVWRAGRVGRDFAVIVEGFVAVSDSTGAPLAVLGPGQVVGELALLGAGIRQATVTTLTPVLLHAGSVREFDSLLEAVPSMRDKVLRAAFARTACAAP